MVSAYQTLKTFFLQIAHLEHLSAMASWDEAVMMPAGGGEARGAALATLERLKHERMAQKKWEDLLHQANEESLSSEWDRANLKWMEKSYWMACGGPGSLIEKAKQASIRCEQAWRVMRAENNWQEFYPLLQTSLQYQIEIAEIRAELFKLSPYDVMLDSYLPGVNQAFLNPLFAELKKTLPSFIQTIVTHQSKQVIVEPKGPFPIEAQREISLELMKTMGFDFNHGRLDVSHHPFCGGVPQDVRLTTRYSTDLLLSALMGTCHETGHALYEQQLPANWLNQPVGHSLGMAVHESQSLLMEMDVCRSLEFLRFLSPKLNHSFGPQSAFEPHNLFYFCTRVRPSLIRVEADEVTYPLHVILRYELEQQLVSGRLRVKELPEAWDHHMHTLLGIRTQDDNKNGVMQDVHWPAGIFGYFPAYTVGRLIAAQLFSSLQKAEPHVLQHIEKGDFTALLAWLQEHVHSKGSLLSMDELLIQATGETLSPRFFIEHIHQRYKA